MIDYKINEITNRVKLKNGNYETYYQKIFTIINIKC